MPGVIMETADGSYERQKINEGANGAPVSRDEQVSHSAMDGPVHVNGTGTQTSQKPGSQDALVPYELPHITQGFFPFSMLVNRAVQQCYNELSELVTELAAIQVSPESSTQINGKLPSNQSAENVHKKMRILDFAHLKRAEFIKLLVLSQWSRQAAEVSNLIDISAFIRSRHHAFSTAVQSIGEMKQDLVRAQVANPDLKTALEVLSKGRVGALPHFGYKPPKPLTARATLKALHKINRIISIRLAVHDSVPPQLRNYRVHDGRVTFTVPGEFELDLSVAEETHTSQFFFVDIRFDFQPSSPIPKGNIFNELDAKINEILYNDGLLKCFEFLNGLVLTNKVNTLFRQAVELTLNLWADCLRIEFLHRTLVIQYWPTRPGPKSWIEIGVQRGPQTPSGVCVPRLGIRWMRDGQQADTDSLRFDTKNLDIERVLRGVIALHTSHLLSSAFSRIRKFNLFSSNRLNLRGQLSQAEPGDCQLDVQLTSSRSLRVSVEPLSGAITFGAHEITRPDVKNTGSAVDELIARVTRLRCATAIEEVESGTKAIGLDKINPRTLGIDPRRVFPSHVLHTAFFIHPLFDKHWAVAATSSMDGDGWWLVHTPLQSHIASASPSAHLVRDHLAMSPSTYTAGAELIHGLAGILAVYANAKCLSAFPDIHLEPPLETLLLGPELQIPEVTFRYKPSTVPSAIQIPQPRGGKYVRDNVRLSFHGIDYTSQSTVLVAYGTFQQPMKFLPFLLSKTEPSLIVLSPTGFALRLLVSAGQSVVLRLFERLQRLECVISIIQSLVEKKMTPSSYSLSQVAFSYGLEQKFAAQVDIDVPDPSISDHIDISHALSMADPLFHMRMKISFESPSPHRRIQEALTVALNTHFAKSGVSTVLAYMLRTFPLLQSLDKIVSTPTGSSIMHVTVRGPTDFQFHYPQLQSRFRLSTRPQKGRVVWLLEDSNKQPVSGTEHVSNAVREKIYNMKGTGWQGQGDGAISELDTIGGLLSELQACLSACPPVPQPSEPEVKQLGGIGAPQAGIPVAQAPVAPQRVEPPNNPDIITID